MTTKKFRDLYPDQDRWPLATALSWIAFRSKGVVDHIAPNGVLDPTDDDSSPMVMDALAAAPLLWPFLASGRVPATAIFKGERLLIHPRSWENYHASLSLGAVGFDIDANHQLHNVEQRLTGIEVSRSDILDLWPEEIRLTHLFHNVTKEEVSTQHRFYLGQVVDWIFHRGEPRTFKDISDFDAAHSAAEREMFEAIDKTGAEVRGQNADTRNGDERVPSNHWRRLSEPRDIPHKTDPEYYSCDPGAELLLGGVLVFKHKPDPDWDYVKRTRYEECYVSGDFVRQHWPLEVKAAEETNPHVHDLGESHVADGGTPNLTRTETSIHEAALHLWPDGNQPHRVAVKYKSVRDYFLDKGEPIPGDKTLQRYFKKVQGK